MLDTLGLIYRNLPFLLRGISVTLELVISAIALGFAMGITMAIIQVYGRRWGGRLVSFYVWFFRGLPNLVLLFLFYFGLFPALGLDVSAFFIAVLVLGLRSAAYQSQVFRGAIQSINEGQMQAARSLGMSRIQAVKNIILPQALRLALPGWSNEYPILLTDSSVTYAIGVMEILTRGNLIVSRTYRPMPIYITCALIFLLLNYGGMRLLQRLEKKLAIPGFGREE